LKCIPGSKREIADRGEVASGQNLQNVSGFDILGSRQQLGETPNGNTRCLVCGSFGSAKIVSVDSVVYYDRAIASLDHFLESSQSDESTFSLVNEGNRDD